MEKTSFPDITIMDVIHHCSVSRPTFYRLFDNLSDILYWKCEQSMLETIEYARANPSASFEELFAQFSSFWMQNRILLQLLVRNSMTDILFQLHANHIDDIKNIFFADRPMSEMQREYLACLLSAIIPAVFKIWSKHPEQDPRLFFSQLKNGIATLYSVFSTPKK
ncbi:MAG: TetR/AcrR family transcriptional regulator [Eubacteriales bacterium]|nr:TetR/AcrR family transcriptional regulator [Eubacteriales bacterium]